MTHATHRSPGTHRAPPCTRTVAGPGLARYRRARPLLPHGDDEHLLFLLMATWSLHSGNPMPRSAPGDLGADQLIQFWADPAMTCRADVLLGREGQR